MLSKKVCHEKRSSHNSFECSLWASWGTHPAVVSGLREWANRELFEALRPSFRDLATKAENGSKSPQNQVRRGCANVSMCLGMLLNAIVFKVGIAFMALRNTDSNGDKL